MRTSSVATTILRMAVRISRLFSLSTPGTRVTTQRMSRSCVPVRTGRRRTPSAVDALSAAELIEILEEYLAAHPAAALLEDGRVLFDMRLARHSIAQSHIRCLLQLWSTAPNACA